MEIKFLSEDVGVAVDDRRHGQLSLICLFLNMDLDYLCAARNAPYHS